MSQPLRFRSRWPPGSSVRWSDHTSHAYQELIPIADDRLPLAEVMAKAGDGDFLRSIAGLLAGLFDTRPDMARHAGQARSGAKAAAARANGAKGGRPRKSAGG